MKKFKIDQSTVASIKNDIFKRFSKSVKDENILQIIKDLILAGVSPVSGVARRFQKYSVGYKAFIKKKKKSKNPTKVNMTLSGEMMDSMFLKDNNSKQTILIGFTDKKAEYHNDLGAGKSRVIRRLLPNKKGEEFVKNVNVKLKQLSKETTKKALALNKKKLSIKIVLKKKL